MDCRCACAEPSYGLWFGSAYGILCKLLRLPASFGSSVSTSKKEGSKAYCSCLSDFSEPQQKKLLTHRRLFEWVEQVLRQGLKAHRPEACLLFFLNPFLLCAQKNIRVALVFCNLQPSILWDALRDLTEARLAQSAELFLVVVGSSPTVGVPASGFRACICCNAN